VAALTRYSRGGFKMGHHVYTYCYVRVTHVRSQHGHFNAALALIKDTETHYFNEHKPIKTLQ